MPFSYFINRLGRVRYFQLGFDPSEMDEIRKKIRIYRRKINMIFLKHKTKIWLIFFYWIICSFTAACTENVAAWERGNLAKPQMALDSNGLDAALMRHTFVSKEASSGGYSVGGGGCGCN